MSSSTVTPADLHIRRLAYGVSRETIAGISGLPFDFIRQAERPTFHVVLPEYVAALEKIGEAHDALADRIVTDALREAEGGFAVLLWDYHNDEFAEMCPYASDALGYPDIYRGAMIEAMRIIESGDDPPEVRIARMMRSQYLAFAPEAGLPDNETTRRKW